MTKKFTAQVATFRAGERYDSVELNVRDLAVRPIPFR